MSALLVTLMRGRFILNLLLSFSDYFQHTGISLRSTINIIMKSTERALSPGKYYFFHTIKTRAAKKSGTPGAHILRKLED